MRQWITLAEHAMTRDITPEMVIRYMRDPAHRDVHACYEEQTAMAAAGDLIGVPDLDQWITDMVPDVKQKIEASLRDGLIYRGLTEEVRNPVGIHWSTSYEVAHDFAVGGPILTAHIDEQHVDWLGTVARRIFWDNADESELTLIPGSPVRLTDGSIVRA